MEKKHTHFIVQPSEKFGPILHNKGSLLTEAGGMKTPATVMLSDYARANGITYRLAQSGVSEQTCLQIVKDRLRGVYSPGAIDLLTKRHLAVYALAVAEMECVEAAE